jgi:hypothetical protein
MRLWSLHPKYLDARGLVAVWREGLLAKAVLLGQTRGYLHHPQLLRFRQQSQPDQAINYYLEQIALEASSRGYHFDTKKILTGLAPQKMPVTEGQLRYEFSHLMQKLAVRDPERAAQFDPGLLPQPNPIFYVVPGEIEPWEKVAGVTSS